MLDFRKVLNQIGKVGIESLADREARQKVVAQAQEAWESATANARQIQQKLETSSLETFWPVVDCLDAFGSIYPAKPADRPHTVVAVDGSQIMPSHHEIHTCFLINIGYAVLSYGQESEPLLDTVPHLFHTLDDLYPLVDRRRIHIDELYVSLKRFYLEIETLVDQSLKARERELPVVALVDGSLIPWSVDKMPPGFKQEYLLRLESLFEKLHEARIPTAGYLSHSRASDIVNALRVWKCPYEISSCRTHCGHLKEEDFPCSTLWPLSDRFLMKTKLDRYHRSGAYLSGSPAARAFAPEHHTAFLLLNVGFEACRLEFPRWMYNDTESFDLAVSAVLGQVLKGKGYPVSLTEAHHLAVVKSSDRNRFFELLSQHLISLGVERVSVSPKESTKRKGFV